MNKSFSEEFSRVIEPLIISNEEIGRWEHPFLDKILPLYADDKEENGVKGPWIEFKLMDSQGNNLDFIVRFFDYERYKSFIRRYDKESIENIAIGKISEAMEEDIAILTVSLLLYFIEDLWYPEGRNKPPFNKSDYAADILDIFDFSNHVVCLSITPNVLIPYDEVK